MYFGVFVPAATRVSPCCMYKSHPAIFYVYSQQAKADAEEPEKRNEEVSGETGKPEEAKKMVRS